MSPPPFSVRQAFLIQLAFIPPSHLLTMHSMLPVGTQSQMGEALGLKRLTARWKPQPCVHLSQSPPRIRTWCSGHLGRCLTRVLGRMLPAWGRGGERNGVWLLPTSRAKHCPGGLSRKRRVTICSAGTGGDGRRPRVQGGGSGSPAPTLAVMSCWADPLPQGKKRQELCDWAPCSVRGSVRSVVRAAFRRGIHSLEKDSPYKSPCTPHPRP